MLVSTRKKLLVYWVYLHVDNMCMVTYLYFVHLHTRVSLYNGRSHACMCVCTCGAVSLSRVYWPEVKRSISAQEHEAFIVDVYFFTTRFIHYLALLFHLEHPAAVIAIWQIAQYDVKCYMDVFIVLKDAINFVKYFFPYKLSLNLVVSWGMHSLVVSTITQLHYIRKCIRFFTEL